MGGHVRSSGTCFVRVAIMWLDVYQTPAVVAKSWTDEFAGFAGEVKRKLTGGTSLAPITVESDSLNKLGERSSTARRKLPFRIRWGAQKLRERGSKVPKMIIAWYIFLQNKTSACVRCSAGQGPRFMTSDLCSQLHSELASKPCCNLRS